MVKTVVSIILFLFNDGNDGVVKLNSLQVPILLYIVQDMEQDVHSSSNDKSELYITSTMMIVNQMMQVRYYGKKREGKTFCSELRPLCKVQYTVVKFDMI